MFLTVVAVSLVLGLVSGGKISHLGDIDLDRLGWIVGSFLVKIGSNKLLSGRVEPSSKVCLALSLVTYLMLFYGLCPNLRFPGFRVLTFGTFLNFIVILANGGRMPVDLSPLGPDVLNSQIPVLVSSSSEFLSKTPTTFSLGEILMAVGIFAFIMNVMHAGFLEGQKNGRIKGNES